MQRLYTIANPVVQFSTVLFRKCVRKFVFERISKVPAVRIVFDFRYAKGISMQSRSTTTAILLIILVIIGFPVIISVIGGVFGIIGGIFGAVFGAIFGILGGLFGWMFNWHWPFFFHWNACTVILIAVVVLLLTRSRKI